MIRKSIIFLICIIICSSVTFAEDINNWNYSKDIKFEDIMQYKSVFLDEDVYRFSKKDLSDLRIVNDKDQFVPYYIFNEYLTETKEVYVEYEAKEVLSFMKKNDKYSDFKITTKENDSDIVGNKLLFEIGNSNFLKNVKVYGGYDNKKWELIKEDVIYETDLGKKTYIELDKPYKYLYYRIVFINDIENTSIESFKVAFNKKEVLYDNYKKTKKLEYSISNDKNGDTVILLDNKDGLKINNIKIISKDDFKRNYHLTYKYDGEYDVTHAGEIHKISLQNFKEERTSIDIGDFTSSDKIKLVIANKDNKPIKIEDIEVNYYIDKLVFKDDGSNKYKLSFGNDQATKLNYDIEAYRNYIEEEEQEIGKFTKLNENKVDIEDPKKNIDYKLIFNGIIICISIFLMVVIMKKLK
ncbi:hypothetical protein IZY60_06920 [Lutibacter sp. B2]|nr:hypothetical protein [Lutibacter sp. B2]